MRPLSFSHAAPEFIPPGQNSGVPPRVILCVWRSAGACSQQPQAPLDLLAVFHIQSGNPACSPRRETGEALPVADEASLFRGRLPISGYAGSADWFEPTVYSLLGYLRAKSRICGGELTCLQQPQASLDLLAVFHIQSGDPFAHRTGQYPTGISIPAGALSLDSNGPK